MKKALLKLLGLTLLFSLILRFILPYCRFALDVRMDSLRFFMIGLLIIPLLLAIIMGIIKKKVYVEFLAITCSTLIANGMTCDIVSYYERVKLGNKLYFVKSKLYNKWGIECVDVRYGAYLALVRNQNEEELVLAFGKISGGFGESPNSEFEVHAYNLSTDDMFIFVFDDYVREVLDKRGYMLIDHRGIDHRGTDNKYNPFNSYYKNYNKTSNVIENNTDDEDEEWYESNDYNTTSTSSSTSTSTSSSSGSGYVPRLIYTGTDVSTGVSVGTDNVGTGANTTIQVEKRCHLCAGTGICTTCNGRGTMINSYTSQYEDCPNCSNPIGKCHLCGGTGRR